MAMRMYPRYFTINIIVAIPHWPSSVRLAMYHWPTWKFPMRTRRRCSNDVVCHGRSVQKLVFLAAVLLDYNTYDEILVTKSHYMQFKAVHYMSCVDRDDYTF